MECPVQYPLCGKENEVLLIQLNYGKNGKLCNVLYYLRIVRFVNNLHQKKMVCNSVCSEFKTM